MFECSEFETDKTTLKSFEEFQENAFAERMLETHVIRISQSTSTQGQHPLQQNIFPPMCASFSFLSVHSKFLGNPTWFCTIHLSQISTALLSWLPLR